ncbi:glycosyltransferase family 2 protein [Falsirhodobacter algicola]|uniref:Glycosyltransferase family 2 protein n=1 Tax=Falsirhodobacter algicola TaxID=2692330 RepID=A0A8J8SKK4_9RHOB|nr:glycosyltransferase family 2 protein [Falsirhodobacter algicola]QUS36040.1 glycosyltransferase family 2 protein [Falsirhodobacter algicola]
MRRSPPAPPAGIGELRPPGRSAAELRVVWGLGVRRRRLLWRAWQARRALTPRQDRTAAIRPGDILCFSCIRNEAERLPHFLAHTRALGVRHFLIVDNGSDDGSAAYLAQQPDVSLWSVQGGYKAARFGVDWTSWLQTRYGHGHWCLTLDADELLIYPYWQSRDLHALTGWLEGQGRRAFPAMMLDLYPKGPLSSAVHVPGQDPTERLCWFDHGNYSWKIQPRMRNFWIQGGPRSRALLDDPRRGPTLNKVPLILWRRGYVYSNSTHSALPRALNRVYDEAGGEAPSGLLLHTKFLNTAPARATEEKGRGEHFFDGRLYDGYYDAVAADPDLWHPHAQQLRGWRHLEALGLMSRGGWI